MVWQVAGRAAPHRSGRATPDFKAAANSTDHSCDGEGEPSLCPAEIVNKYKSEFEPIWLRHKHATAPWRSTIGIDIGNRGSETAMDSVRFRKAARKFAV